MTILNYRWQKSSHQEYLKKKETLEALDIPLNGRPVSMAFEQAAANHLLQLAEQAKTSKEGKER